MRLPRVPTVPLLAALCLAQLGVAIAVGLAATHNHFVWYSGGDSTEYWTSSWALAHWQIPQATVGYGVPLLYAWVPLVAGATLLAGLPVITLLQLIVLVPLAALLVWAIGDLLFGRRFAWWALVLWILGPLLMLWGFHGGYPTVFRDLFLAPHWYGLTNMADMPSLVAVLAAAWATLRLHATGRIEDAVLAGLLAGVAIAIKPANGFFVPAVLVLLAATRSPRAVGAWLAAVVPSLIALALWKDKGLGNLPLLAVEQARVALGAHPVVGFANTYVHLDFSHLQGELDDLRNVFWSARLLEFLAVAGLLGALRRSLVKGAFLGVWCGAFCIVKGSSSLASIPSANYFRYVEPGLPAFALLAASVVFLVPERGLPRSAPHVPGRLLGGTRTLAGVAFVTALVPVLLMAAIPAASSPDYVQDFSRGNYAAISSRLAVSAEAHGRDVTLTWHAVDSSSTGAYYVIYRARGRNTCEAPSDGAAACNLQMTSIGLTRGTTYVDRPPAGTQSYRVGLFANYQDNLDGSDLMLLGPATATTAR